MSIKVIVNYPEDITILQEKATEILTDILYKRLKPQEIKDVIEVLEDESKNIAL